MTEVVTISDVRSQMVAELSAEMAGEVKEAPVEAASDNVEEIAADEIDGDSGEQEAVASGEDVPNEDPDQGEEERAEGPVVDPPLYWSDENKEKFALLPLELQETLKEEWVKGDKLTNKRVQEATEARNAADKQAKTLSEITERVSAATDLAERAFGDKWQGADPAFWAKLARENPENYNTYKAQYDADQHALQQSRTARDAANQVQRDGWVQEQAQQLKTMIPQLADQKQGKPLADKITQYMVTSGVPEQAIPDIAAVGYQFAWKAMLWDEAQKAKPTPQKTVPSALPGKSAPVSREAVQQTQLKSVRGKAWAPTGTREDMVRLMIAEGFN